MSDEFDEIPRPLGAPAPRDNARCSGTPISRLVARLYASAGNPLRVRLLRCLMRPLGPLGAAGVAGGAFAVFLNRQGDSEPVIGLDAVSRVSAGQVYELARFVEQVDPQALEQFARLASSSPLAVATFSASVLVLLFRRLNAEARSVRWQ